MVWVAHAIHDDGIKGTAPLIHAAMRQTRKVSGHAASVLPCLRRLRILQDGQQLCHDVGPVHLHTTRVESLRSLGVIAIWSYFNCDRNAIESIVAPYVMRWITLDGSWRDGLARLGQQLNEVSDDST